MIEKILEEVDIFELFEGIAANNLILSEKLDKIKKENKKLKKINKNLRKKLNSCYNNSRGDLTKNKKSL